MCVHLEEVVHEAARPRILVHLYQTHAYKHHPLAMFPTTGVGVRGAYLGHIDVGQRAVGIGEQDRGAVDLAGHAAALELHHVLRQRARLVAEHELDLRHTHHQAPLVSSRRPPSPRRYALVRGVGRRYVYIMYVDDDDATSINDDVVSTTTHLS